jgi:ubiquinone/menaquinone biosynthesis C-methylase UbiE
MHPIGRDEVSEAGTWIPAWDGAAYAANTGHHREHDAWFLRSFPVRPTDRVLDLGCGAGDFTRTIADLVPRGHVVGLDAQASMVEEARRRAAPRQTFLVAPVQALAEVLPPGPDHDATFDAVTSRAVLHWVPAGDWPGVLAAAHRLLRPGGFLRIECGGGGNVPTVVAVLDRLAAPHGGPRAPWTFADAGAAYEWAERAGFEMGDDGYVNTVVQRRPFDRGAFTGWLHSQAIEAYRTGMAPPAAAAFTAEVDAALDEFRRADGTFDQTYVRLDLLLRKPAG